MSMDSEDGILKAPKRLPVIILADVSLSMTAALGEKTRIQALNDGIEKLIAKCKEIPSPQAEINIMVITFGAGVAELALAMTPIADANWRAVAANGNTPLGEALRLANRLLASPAIVTRRDYRPIVIISSDGGPNDEWTGPLAEFDASAAGAKADRFAVAIGADDDQAKGVLSKFLEPALKSKEASARMFTAGREKEMADFFEYVGWTTKVRSTSKKPNQVASEQEVKDAGADQRDNPDGLPPNA